MNRYRNVRNRYVAGQLLKVEEDSGDVEERQIIVW